MQRASSHHGPERLVKSARNSALLKASDNLRHGLLQKTHRKHLNFSVREHRHPRAMRPSDFQDSVQMG